MMEKGDDRRALVARAREISLLSAALTRAKDDGRGQLVLLRGEPGIGKSTLANVFARDAAEAGFSVVLGRAWELAEAPPYFPVSPCLRALGLLSSDHADAFRLWEDVLTALSDSSAQKPIAWILEDIHAADLQTLDLLTFLARPIHGLRVLIVATARKLDPRITERVNQRLVRIARDGLDIELSPLAEHDVAELASRVIGRPLTTSAMKELTTLTSGNPLFVVECARVFQSSGAAPRSVTSLPHTIRQVVSERVDLLPAKTKSVLAAAAIVGRESSAAMVARMMKRDAMPANIIDAMLPAVDAGIVIETRPGHFAFTHILVRDAIEDSIPAMDRAALHAAAETDLEAHGGEGADVLVERARHALAAAGPSTWMNRGFELGQRAAKMLEDLGAFDRALAMYERIGPPAPSAESMRDRLHVARIAQKAGRHATGRAICEEVLAWARSHHDAELLANAALTLGTEFRPAIVDRVLVSALEEARVALTAIETPLGCRVLARLAAAMQPAVDREKPIAMAREAIALARGLGDDDAVYDTLHMGLAALVDFGDPAERRKVAEELLELTFARQDTARGMRALMLLAVDHAELGNFSAFDECVERALELSVRAGHPKFRWRALLLGAMRALPRGDVATADRYVVEAQELAALNDEPALMFSLNAHLAGTAKALHRDDELRTILANIPAMVAEAPRGAKIGAALSAGCYAVLEDEPGAQRVVGILNGSSIEEGPFFGSVEAEAAAFIRDVPVCTRLRDAFLPMIDMHLVGGNVQVSYCGPVRRIVGLLESALGNHDVAIDHLERSIEAMKREGFRTFVAQCQYDLGRALQRRTAEHAPHNDAATRAFEEAARLAEDIGMPGLVMRARARLASSPRAPASPVIVDAASASASASSSSPVTMTSEGDTWRIEHDRRTIRVKDSRGMQLLARLVERPGEEIHVLVLASDDASASVHDAVGGGGGDVLDARARREYKERLGDLNEELEEAERNGDRGRTEKLQREKEALEGEVKRALGLGGKARGAASVSERARVNIQRRLKDAITQIAKIDASTGRFFEKSVRTGTFCRFFV